MVYTSISYKKGSDPSSAQREAVPRWGQERRLEFIDFRLLWEGRINRAEIVDFFGISIQQASLDLARYMQAAPANLAYDKSEKVYRATDKFKAAFANSQSQAFLNQLLAVTTGTLNPTQAFMGWKPPCDVVQFPARTIHPEVLIRLLWAIRDREALEVTYQSMRRPTATRRWIAPHAVAFDGSRWHARAWCFEHSEFRDFVFSRVQQIHRARPSDIDSQGDTHWHRYTKVIIHPRGELTPEQKAAVETDFGMVDGRLEVPIREALVFYFVRHLQLGWEGEPQKRGQPIEWVNEAELRPLLLEAMRK